MRSAFGTVGHLGRPCHRRVKFRPHRVCLHPHQRERLMGHHRRTRAFHHPQRALRQDDDDGAMPRLPETQLADDHPARRHQLAVEIEGRQPKTRRSDSGRQAEDRRRHHLLHHRPHDARQPAVAQRGRHRHAAPWRQDRQFDADVRPPSVAAKRHVRERQRLLWHRRGG